MDNFVYYNPTILCYGKGACEEIAKRHLIPEGARVMMTYGGGSIKKNGVYEEVHKYVTPVCEFGGIEPNPHHETCMKAVAMAKENKIDFLLAVGGGSVVDATKYIALAMEHTSTPDPFDILANPMTTVVAPAKAKIGVVLTIPATGSEMNIGFVITKMATQAKKGCLNPSVAPYFSVVDPCHTFSLPVNQVRNGLCDAFVHVVEQYQGHFDKGYVQDEECEGVMRTLIRVGRQTMDEPTNYAVRMNFCYAATVALNNTLNVGLAQCWAAHYIGHELTTYYGVAHGESLVLTLPAVMRFYKEKNGAKYKQMAERVFGVANGTADDAIAGVVGWFKSIDCKLKLREYGATKEHFATIAAKFKENKLGSWKDIDDVAVMSILEDLY